MITLELIRFLKNCFYLYSIGRVHVLNNIHLVVIELFAAEQYFIKV